MRRWLFVVLLIGLIAGGATAQDDPDTGALVGPLTTLHAGDFRALAVTADGERLLVADAATAQVRVYGFDDPAAPELLSSLDVSGVPVLMAGGRNYALVAVTTDEPLDTIDVIAPAFSSPRAQFVAGRNYISIAKNPRALALSPDGRWGIAVSEGSYKLLEIINPGEINDIEIDQRLADAALTNTTAYLLRGDELVAAPLESGEALRGERALALEGSPSQVVVNADATAGVLVDGERLLFFDPQRLALIGEMALGADVVDLGWAVIGDGDVLVVAREGENALLLIDASDAQNPVELGSSTALEQPIIAMAVHENLLIATDGTTINIFASS